MSHAVSMRTRSATPARPVRGCLLGGVEADHYPSAVLLTSSVQRNWSSLCAELRAHPAGPVISCVSSQTEVVVVLRGSTVISRRALGIRHRVLAARGSVWINPTEVTQDCATLLRPLPRVLHLFVPTTALTRVAAQMGRPEARVQYLTGFRDPLIEEIGAAVLQELRAPTPAGDALIESLSNALVARLLYSYSTTPPQTPLDAASARGSLSRSRLQRVLQFIEERLDDPITVAELAAAAHLSEFYFSRAFKWATGQSPMSFVVGQRLTRAKIWLTESDKTLLEIAHRCQFATYGSFSRAFLRATGMTPAQFRKRQR